MISRTRVHLSLHRARERVHQRQLPLLPDLRNRIAVRRAVLRSRALDGRSRLPLARWSVTGDPCFGLVGTGIV